MALDDARRFRLVSIIGEGGFGTVVKAHDLQNGELVAIKLIQLRGLDAQREEELHNSLQRETLIHRKLVHPSIVALKEAFLIGAPTDPRGDPTFMALVMELCSDGSLLQYANDHVTMFRRRLPEHQTRWFFQTLVCTLDYIHQKGVAHRDIKLENTLIQVQAGLDRLPLLKICDFGLSKGDGPLTTRVGTPNHSAPEVVENVTGEPYNGEKVDVFSAGVMLYGLLRGAYPFPGLVHVAANQRQFSPAMYLQQIAAGPDLAWLPNPDQQELGQLLTGMLRKDPVTRLSLADIKKHPWFLHGLEDNACAITPVTQQMLDTAPVCLQSEAELQALINIALDVVHRYRQV